MAPARESSAHSAQRSERNDANERCVANACVCAIGFDECRGTCVNRIPSASTATPYDFCVNGINQVGVPIAP
jgi:hypothetical protein